MADDQRLSISQVRQRLTRAATLAGPNTGNVVVAVEYPSMVSMAESNAKVGPTPEWQKFIAEGRIAKP